MQVGKCSPAAGGIGSVGASGSPSPLARLKSCLSREEENPFRLQEQNGIEGLPPRTTKMGLEVRKTGLSEP